MVFKNDFPIVFCFEYFQNDLFVLEIKRFPKMDRNGKQSFE